MVSRAAVPSRERNSEDADKVVSPCASSSTTSGRLRPSELVVSELVQSEMSQPFFPCSIISSIPCLLQAITGLPHAMASRYTHPSPSKRLGNTKTEQVRIASATSARLFLPSN